MPVPSNRIDLAKKRVVSNLTDRIYMNRRQLESKISEAGPFNQRCDPHVISIALSQLVGDGSIIKEHTQSSDFYHLPVKRGVASKGFFEARKQKILTLYDAYKSLASGDSTICGDALETVVTKAIQNTNRYQEIGSKKNPQITFGNVTLPGSFDNLLLLPSPVASLICVEDKNIREWLYPASQELWSLINKASKLIGSATPPLPIIITRRIPYYSRKAFKALGILGFETRHQYFDPSVEDQLTEIKHKHGLGFFDIETKLEPPAGLIKFFDSTIPEQAHVYTQQFASNREIFNEYAPQLQNKRLSHHDRRNLWAEVKHHLDLGHLEE